MKAAQKWVTSLGASKVLMVGYALVSIIGTLGLALPWASNESQPFINHLFVAFSAVSTTGLSPVDVGQSYTLLGQIIILALIQVGGLGYMSLASFVVLLTKKNISPQQNEMLRSDFSLPEGFKIKSFVGRLVIFALIMETFGFIVLAFIFGRAGVSNYLWSALFHSVSAFCTAGFSLFSSGLSDYANNFWLNAVISILSLAGALGFIVISDVIDRLKGARDQLTFTTRIIFKFTFAGILLGSVLLFLGDTHLEQFAYDERLIMAFFQTMSALTTVGFNTIDVSLISPAPLFLITLLMLVGASPSGTGGGIKSTTFTALYAQLMSTIKGRKNVVYMNRIIPKHREALAVSNFFFYALVVVIGIYLLLLVETQAPAKLVFEAISALGTVGLSIGATSTLSTLGKLVIIALMFMGRVGPLSFDIAIFGTKAEPVQREEDIVL